MFGFITFFGLILLLWFGRTILIPLLMAIFLWYLTNAIFSYYRMIFPHKKSDKTKNKYLHILFNWISGFLSAGTIIGLIFLFITQIQPMARELIKMLPELQSKIILLSKYISDYVGISFNASMLPDITKIAANVGTSAAGLVASFGIVVIYMLFMFIEQSTFHKKFTAMIPQKRQLKKMRYILDSIDKNMKRYLFMKTLISAVTGLAAYIWLQMIGLEFAGVWAFIVFIANYIPTIGAFVACSLPILFSLIMAPTLNQPILTAAGLIGIQIVFGNIIEPKLTGTTLNLSTLAILINLVFWGVIWGIAGMFFSVPILATLFIVTAQFDSTRWVAVLLSADGNIPDKREE